jgi:hypothetical protein
VLIRKDAGITGVKQMAGASSPGEIGERRRRAQGGRPGASRSSCSTTIAPASPPCRRGASTDSADETLLSFAAKGAPQDFTFIPDDPPRTAGFGIKKNEPRFTEFVDQTLLELEAAGAAAKIFDADGLRLRRGCSNSSD